MRFSRPEPKKHPNHLTRVCCGRDDSPAVGVGLQRQHSIANGCPAHARHSTL
jgi:hypothetical protein